MELTGIVSFMEIDFVKFQGQKHSNFDYILFLNSFYASERSETKLYGVKSGDK